MVPIEQRRMANTGDIICSITEQELWSVLDRGSDELDAHLARCPRCRAEAAMFRADINVVRAGEVVEQRRLPEKIGPYAIVRVLGEGGMGIVYEGRQRSPDRPVAVKVIRGGEHVDEYRIRLFRREAQTLGRLRHPAIAAIHEAGLTEDGQHYLVMELVQGRPLNEYVRDHGVSRADRLALFRKVCDAIQYAHQRGVIHRDLKPTNILVDAEGQPKILDFGLARISDEDSGIPTTQTIVGKVMGTLPYMSPEEAKGLPDEIDVRSDVYSLGVILYELLTGQLPYSVRGKVLHEAVRVVCEEEPRWPRHLDHSISHDLAAVSMKALAKDRYRRYQTVAALTEDLDRLERSQPIVARRAGFGYHAWKFLVRQRVTFGFAAVALAVVLAAFTWVHRAERGLQKAAQTQNALEELRGGINELKLAQLHARLGEFDEAERGYRGALVTFQNLEHGDRAAQTMVEWAEMMLRRGEEADLDHSTRLFLAAENYYYPTRVESPARWSHCLDRLGTVYAELPDGELRDAVAILLVESAPELIPVPGRPLVETAVAGREAAPAPLPEQAEPKPETEARTEDAAHADSGEVGPVRSPREDVPVTPLVVEPAPPAPSEPGG
jgi:predicted Ser/Thr protein kinase